MSCRHKESPPRKPPSIDLRGIPLVYKVPYSPPPLGEGKFIKGKRKLFGEEYQVARGEGEGKM